MLKALWNSFKNAGTAFKQTLQLSSATNWFYRDVDTTFGGASYRNLTQLAIRNPLARRAIDFIAENIASIELELVEVNEEGEKENIAEHPILDLLNNPDGDANRHTKEWLFSGMVWALMGGGEYWLRGVSPEMGPNEGMPKRLQLFSRRHFNHFLYDGEGFVQGYNLTLERAGWGSKNIDSDVEETHHAFTYHPLRQDRGLPILLSVLRQMDIIEDSDEWNKAISGSKGQMPGFFRPTGMEGGQQLDPTTREQAQEQVDKQVNNARKGNKWLVLSGAYEPVDRSITPKEASWIESSKYFGRLIATGIGIDPSLLGDDSAQTYDNFRTALFVAWTTRIIPMFLFILNGMNRHLVPKFEDEGQTLQLGFDPMRIDAVEEALLQKIERLVEATNSPVLTPDEARQILGYDTKDIDSLIMPLNVQPHERIMPEDVDIPNTGEGTRHFSNEEIEQDIKKILNGTYQTNGFHT